MGGNILVVDDDPKVLEILNKSLKNKGHTVHVAADGKEALDHYEKEPPDLVVLDLMLPDMDGRDVLKKMRAADRHRPVPILFLSASADPDVRVSSLDGGADDFLVKPFSLREFNAKVRKVLGAYREANWLKDRSRTLEQEVSHRRDDYVQMNKDLKRQLLAMKTLFTISQDLNRRLDFDELLNGFALTVVGEIQISSLAIFVRGRERDKQFKLYGLKGFDRKRVTNLTIGADTDFTKRLMRKQEPLKIVRSGDEGWVDKLPDVRLALFEYVTPIIIKQQLKGIVFTGPKLNGNEYSKYELDMLMSLCNSAGIGLDNARLFRELQNTYLSTVKALVSIIEAKDAYTKGHTERVADYCVALAAKMKLTKDEVRNVAFGAVLHDIGKLLVHERILNKPGDLDAEESDVLKQHPEIGASIIENMEFLSGTVPLVRHHHEWFDGSGYPSGIQGDEIPMGARIIAVADSFDAMTTHRPYRDALSWKTALDTLQAKAGTQFDPAVVQNFVDLVEVDGFRPRSFTRFTIVDE